MAIHEVKKQTDIERRLKLLRQQVYGAEEKKLEVKSLNFVPTQSGYLSIQAEVSYLYRDLLKIGIFASIALGTQIILFILFKNNILNLNFF